ncbi:hypothetical protein BO70DRAFT_320059 [Aspergillus heteromorphus CBS 117.55]|uniref:Rhodopsin domain-containing protein n=1 Tax=Aspergillus heteromorphus CBS 117.55 TaxID=1448321 RepID=A0A317VJS4_9EURO|nr:uncharacterized protein BO70DRAFT_320059 [Aspergillus heteromorphus CBS 117.55]PWY73699.1 hypothetical protein BO70DRAFT_320059 [Aspergillus heteromorphus CBS 117.55]
MSLESSYNAGPGILVLNWTAVAITILVMALRVIAKLRIRHFAVDDTIMLCASALALVASIMITLAIENGYGRHYRTLSHASQVLALKYYTGFQCLSIVATGAGRAAFTIYLLNILRQKRAVEIILWVIFGLQIVINCVSVITVLAQCQNVNSIWDTTVISTCWDPNVDRIYAYVQCSINTGTDLFLALFPTYTFWSLNLKKRIKITLIILMSLGLIAMIASIMRIVYLTTISERGDQTAVTVRLTRWALTECYLVIVTASLPCIRSLIIDSVRKSVRNFPSVSRSRPGRSHQYTISGPIASRQGYGNWTGVQASQTPGRESAEFILDGNTELHQLENGRITKQVDVMIFSNYSTNMGGRSHPPL